MKITHPHSSAGIGSFHTSQPNVTTSFNRNDTASRMSTALRLLGDLFLRGDSISIETGRLVHHSIDSNSETQQMLEHYKPEILKLILSKLDMPTFVFESYSTGQYGDNLAGGVTLQLSSIDEHTFYYVIFNAYLSRARSSKTGKKGSRLKNGHFRVSKRHRFYQFWLSTGLKLPPRLSQFHDYMGNLHDIILTGNFCSTRLGRIDASSISSLNLAAEDVSSLLMPNNPHPTTIQLPYNTQTSRPYKEFHGLHKLRGTQRESSTGALQPRTTVISKYGDTGISHSVNTLVSALDDDPDDEWGREYDETEPL